jgi:hypothetical protein
VGTAYRQICDSIKGVIEELDPGVIVVDMLMTPGFDACYALNREFVMSTPNTLGDVAKQDQPWLKGYWHYPLLVLCRLLNHSEVLTSPN